MPIYSEEYVQQNGREFSAYFGTYWRNNVGACQDKTGRVIRYGLANDSKRVNASIKSSDMIGITPVMRGNAWFGVFTAIEWKRSDWVLNMNDPHTAAQAHYHDIVRSQGGFAGFARNNMEFLRIIGQ